MEYYGKILCISKDDLTRDDRPLLEDYQLDVTKAPIMTVSCFDQLAYRKRIQVVCKGIGRGVKSLVSVDSLPDKYKKLVEQKYGSMDVEILRNWFASHWEVDDAARSFYSRFRLPSGKPLEPEQQQEYTSHYLFPFFANMLSEGHNRIVQARLLQIDEKDDFGILLATAHTDTAGAVTIKPLDYD